MIAASSLCYLLYLVQIRSEMSCNVPGKAGWRHTVAIFLLYVARMKQHMERIDEKMPPAQSSKNIRGGERMIPMINSRAAKARKQEECTVDRHLGIQHQERAGAY